MALLHAVLTLCFVRTPATRQPSSSSSSAAVGSSKQRRTDGERAAAGRRRRIARRRRHKVRCAHSSPRLGQLFFVLALCFFTHTHHQQLAAATAAAAQKASNDLNPARPARMTAPACAVCQSQGLSLFLSLIHARARHTHTHRPLKMEPEGWAPPQPTQQGLYPNFCTPPVSAQTHAHTHTQTQTHTCAAALLVLLVPPAHTIHCTHLFTHPSTHLHPTLTESAAIRPCSHACLGQSRHDVSCTHAHMHTAHTHTLTSSSLLGAHHHCQNSIDALLLLAAPNTQPPPAPGV